jgi:triacylglycerol esterase/lipase EstA (alpha/beta hydrolase family)
MQFKLIIKNPDTQEPVAEQVFRSINEICKHLKTSYCSCHSNYLLSIGEKDKQPKKRSQIIFNKKYKIIDFGI